MTSERAAASAPSRGGTLGRKREAAGGEDKAAGTSSARSSAPVNTSSRTQRTFQEKVSQKTVGGPCPRPATHTQRTAARSGRSCHAADSTGFF